MECKALDYYQNLLEKNNYDFEAIKDFLIQTEVGASTYEGTWWEDSGTHFEDTFEDFTAKEIFDMFDMYKPPNNITNEELEQKHSEFYSNGDYAPKCQNTKCKNHSGDKYNWCSYSDWADQCIIDAVYNIQFAFEIGGWSAIDELKPQFDKRIINHICKRLPHNYVGIREKEIYEDGIMNEIMDETQIFFKQLSKINIEEEVTVYWENKMYVKDKSGNQAIANISLYQAYKFAIMINASIFDYYATDKEVKELSEELLNLIDDNFYKINVWEYIDDIATDFEKITGVKLNIDDKRSIVSAMTDEKAYDILCDFGSATYIAKVLWRYIKGDDRIKTKNGDLLFKGCDNSIANELADKYLMSDDYDLNKFAKALKEATEMIEPINFDQYLVQSSRISHKCYSLLGYLIENNIDCKKEILVGYIDWFGDYKEDERYIYCHIDSSKNEIYFQESRKAPQSAYLHDIAFPHLVGDPNRIQKDIGIKFTEQYIDNILKEISNIDDAYTHCHMYGTVGKYTL